MRECEGVEDGRERKPGAAVRGIYIMAVHRPIVKAHAVASKMGRAAT